MSIEDIREADWGLEFHKTINQAPHRKVDMYVLRVGGEAGTVTLGVPHGRSDIAEFVAKSILAGVAVLRSPLGVQLIKSIDQYGPATGFKEN